MTGRSAGPRAPAEASVLIRLRVPRVLPWADGRVQQRLVPGLDYVVPAAVAAAWIADGSAELSPTEQEGLEDGR